MPIINKQDLIKAMQEEIEKATDEQLKILFEVFLGMGIDLLCYEPSFEF